MHNRSEGSCTYSVKKLTRWSEDGSRAQWTITCQEDTSRYCTRNLWDCGQEHWPLPLEKKYCCLKVGFPNYTFTWCILCWSLFLMKQIPNQVLFETTNTMNAPSVSSAETWQTCVWIWSSCSQCIWDSVSFGLFAPCSYLSGASML